MKAVIEVNLSLKKKSFTLPITARRHKFLRKIAELGPETIQKIIFLAETIFVTEQQFF